MTIQQAFGELIDSDSFKKIAKGRDKIGNKYRAYTARFKKGELGVGAMVEILLQNGYEVKANKAKKK
jgi:hypothetical protein